ncbi:MMPL family transporter [Acidisoma sp.]|uniref:MMPL family transporter n=1 Tax=Acidisoma sp. TaxID=1872115 RepID=UPI003B005AE5
MWIETKLAAIARLSSRHAPWLVLAGLLIAVGSAFYTKNHLGIDTNTDDLFSAKLPWRQAQIAMDKDFPQYGDLLVGVVDAKTPEEADATADAIARAARADHAHFRTVRRPDDLAFFKTEGLLFLDQPSLQKLLNNLVQAQPFIGQLAADPSMRGLLTAIGLLGQGAAQGQVDLSGYSTALQGFAQGLKSAASGHPEPISWQRLLGGTLSDKAGPSRFVLVQPVQDYGVIEPGADATAALRHIASEVPTIESGRATFRITGQIALADQQFASLTEGIVTVTVISVLLILLWLVLAVRRLRYILAIVLTLILGLLLTTFFASLAIGTLNLISVAFAVLFVGLAIDFAIQICVRYRDERRLSPDAETALVQTLRKTGNSVLLAAVSIAAGFFAFVPTSFKGVAELGLIAGVGMLIAFACTITFLPALITLLRLPAEGHETGIMGLAPLDGLLRRQHRPVLGLFAVLAIAGVVLLPRITFDSDPLDTQNPHTEAMETLRALASNPVTNPYSIDVLSPSVAAAAGLAAKLSLLPMVDHAISLSSFVPADQSAKLDAIADTEELLAPTLNPGPASPVTPGDIRIAATTAEKAIDSARAKLAPGSPLLAIGADLATLGRESDSQLMAANAALTEFLPVELDNLRSSLSAGPVTLANLPRNLTIDWLTPDGRARVQVLPKASAMNSQGLRSFVNEVTAVAPGAGGSAVTVIDSATTIIDAFREAAVLALVAIAAMLLIFLRRPRDVLLILAPLVLSSLMTVLVIVLLPLPLNFANIIALPLLQGVGVSFNLYFVMNWRAGEQRFLASPTARAILFSALTTGTAFGSLAFSHHPGTASMGLLLLLSLVCTLIATFIFEPALLYAVPPPKATRPAPGTIEEHERVG